MEEIWKDIPEYVGYYQVSNLGRIKRLSTEVYNGFGYYKKSETILIPHLINTGRLIVGLSKNGKVKRFLVHRLVAMTFLEKCDNKKQVNHLDGNPLNNRLENLEWCDQSGNELHKIYTLKHTNGALLSKPRKVRCITTNMEYPSLAQACRSTGTKMYILFNRLKTGKKDPSGNYWEYIV